MHVLSLGVVSLCFKIFLASIIPFLIFSFSLFCLLVAFICFQFLGYFCIFTLFLFLVELVLGLIVRPMMNID